ncbi:hypothetical protein SCP_0410510 [Sparassis crispa]|uniref:Uncharacterized protein n=1 Tax=Sparassis crispa TaxID=139825 RepID=A0A401GKH7_9APHY|nr:hypothetical protein SCP_0410510 [Sparassis crispa]GBE82666.1 hypothetical protein SCP_0410510 [Sparassis crispa]
MSNTPTGASARVESSDTPTPRPSKRQRQTANEDHPSPTPSKSALNPEGSSPAQPLPASIQETLPTRSTSGLLSRSGEHEPGPSVPVPAGTMQAPRYSIIKAMRKKDGTLAPGVAPAFDGLLRVATVLKTQPPDIPNLYNEGTKSSTRLPTEFDVWSENGLPRLMEVVPAHETLIDGVFDSANELLATLPVLNLRNHIHQRWLNLVHPALTSRSLPPEIRSEHDTEDWLFSVLIRPAIEVIKAIQLGRFDYDHTNHRYPNVMSGESKDARSIPDGIFIGADWTIRATLEAKTHKVLAAPQPETTSTFYDICVKGAPRRIVHFHWPKQDDDCSRLSTESLILIQVWQQMQDKNVDLAILSSVQSTFFLVKEGVRLYVSRGYRAQHRPLFAVFAFLAVAFGLIPRKVLQDSLPAVEPWNRRFTARTAARPGIDERTMPSLFVPQLAVDD